MLKDLSYSEQNIMFINNDDGLKANGEVLSQLYRGMDKTGVHLNNLGKEILTNHFKAGLTELYYKAKLRDEYDVVPPGHIS